MYYFYFTKGLKTNYIMEDENRTKVYEAKMEKFTLIKPYKFSFINVRDNSSKLYDVTHRVTKSTGIDRDIHTQYRIITDSHIKMNGVNNWQLLKDMGCSYATNMNGIKPCYTLFQNDKKIAEVKTTGSNVYNDEGIMSKLPVNGFFQVICDEKDIEIVFIFCFMIARACILDGAE